MTNLQTFLQQRDLSEVPWVTPKDSTVNALKKIQDSNAGAVLVRESSHIVGLFSERDCINSLIKRGASALVTSVAELMVTKIYYVTPEYHLEDCLKIMIQKQIHHLPIFSGGQILGLLNMELVVDALLEEKNFTITQLTHYITGSPVQEARLSVRSDNVRELHLVRAYEDDCCQLAI
jgi:CBS domain-containing protein